MQLPEIARQVLHHLHDDWTSLHAAIRVNRTWFACGILVLWSDPPYKAFNRVKSSRELRQLYADIIASVRRMPPRILDEGLRLPRLRQLCLSSDVKAADVPRLLPYIQPSLEKLSCGLTQAILAHLVSAEPPLWHLRSLFVGNPSRSDDDDDDDKAASLASFVDWVAQAPLHRLQALNVYLPCGLDETQVLDRALCVFAQLPALQLLTFGGQMPPVRSSTIVKAQAMSGHSGGGGDVVSDTGTVKKFEPLCGLRIPIAAEAVPALCRFLPALTGLSLAIKGSEPMLTAIAALTRLR